MVNPQQKNTERKNKKTGKYKTGKRQVNPVFNYYMISTDLQLKKKFKSPWFDKLKKYMSFRNIYLRYTLC